MNNFLVYFTASYPFGSRETYLHNEIVMMAQHFETVYIIPTYNPTKKYSKRKTPDNVIVLDVLVDQGLKRVIKGIFNTSPFSGYLKEFFHEKIYCDSNKIRKWLNSLLVFRISYYKFKEISKTLENNTILYSYWAEAPLFTTSLSNRFIKVVRMHGGDFYLNRNSNYLPLRRSIYNSCNVLLPISKDIQNILLDYYSVNENKVFLNYLGTYKRNGKNNLEANKEGIIRVASCSNVYELKRVSLIADILSLVNNDKIIEWHHFGDGENEEMEILRKKVNRLDSTKVKVRLHGQVTQEYLYDFYSQNYIHWFINTSRYEGLPVSIMESFSFGIPAIATDVGATNEIVNSTNGYLLPVDFDPEFVATIISSTCEAKEYSEKRESAYETWKSKFDASNNYQDLANKLKHLPQISLG